MSKPTLLIIYIVAMIVVIVGVDLLFFQGSVFGKTSCEHRHCAGVCSFLFEIPEVKESSSLTLECSIAFVGGVPYLPGATF